MPKNLEDSFQKIISSIQESKEYQEYLQLEKKLKENQEIQDLILEIKRLQKELVKLEYNKKNTSEVEHLYQEKLFQLSNYPIYLEFIQKQKLVNEMFQYVRTEIEYFFDKLVLSTNVF